MYRIDIIDRRGLRYAAGYYKTVAEAEKYHDKVTWDCPYWTNNTIEIAETVIYKMPEF